MARTSTPDEVLPNGATRVHVKATCPRCSRILGDATQAEIFLSIENAAIPEAYLEECGCEYTTSPTVPTPMCDIDDCGSVATLVLNSHPDQVRLCDDHKSFAQAIDYQFAGVPVPWGVS